MGGLGVRDIGHHIGLEATDGRDYSTPLEPGIHLSLPVVQQPVRVNRRPRRLGISSLDLKRTKAEEIENTTPKRSGGLNPKRDGYVLTGDANLLHVSLAARISVPPGQYRLHAGATGGLSAQAELSVGNEEGPLRVPFVVADEGD